MQFKTWNFENDTIVTDAPLMFPAKTAMNYMGSAYAVETTIGIFFHKLRSDGGFDLLLADKDGEHLIAEDIMVVASDMKYSCIIVHYHQSGEFFLIDTRGIFFLLEIACDFVDIAAYRMWLDKKSGYYHVGPFGNARWMIRAVSKQKQFMVMMESAPTGEYSLNPQFKTLFSKKNAGKYFYLTIPAGKRGQLIEKILSKGIPYEVIPNVLSDDKSKNIRVPINDTTIQNRAMHFLTAKYHNTYSIADIPLGVYLGTLHLGHKVSGSLGVSIRNATDNQYPKVMSISASLKELYGVETDMQLFTKLFKRILGLFVSAQKWGFENEFTSMILPYPISDVFEMEKNFQAMDERRDYIIHRLDFSKLPSELKEADRVEAYRLYRKIYEASKSYYKEEMARFENELTQA